MLLTAALRRLCPGFAFRLVLAVCGVLLATGCSHYRLGTGATPAFHTLYLEPVGNQTLLPQAQALLSTQLRETFSPDGRVTVVNSPDAADAILRIQINDYHREVGAGREGDTGLARKFNLILG